jgi:acyl carrier protein
MPSDLDVRTTLVKLIAIELSVAEERVASARSLREDLGMDSIAAANLLFLLEEELGVELGEVPQVDTLAELESAVREWIAARAG